MKRYDWHIGGLVFALLLVIGVPAALLFALAQWLGLIPQ